ncbi:MAG: cyclodeaminase/cyclohydrolase family protein [Lachnospiraceae bacterium]|nr:cyclodeaminase/cyclohydrolase family protein [Lachnospiraceae bacterium]
MRDFLNSLASSDPTPGGGGASALIASIGCCLCSMVANLTTGKKKYAQYQDKIDEYLVKLKDLNEILLKDIDKDAEAFKPLAAAYSLDKSTPGYDVIMENATYEAALAPLEITRDIYKLVPIIEDLSVMGSRLAISDVAVAASATSAALKGVVMNVYINTRSLKDREAADKMNVEADKMVNDGCARLGAVYDKIKDGLTC